jgi:predicted nucleic acid-binding protein
VLQYLHQLELLHILPALATTLSIPPGVVDELEAGLKLGINLPDPANIAWITIQESASNVALPLVNDLGRGEAEVLMLALEKPAAIAVLDDALARWVAKTLQLKFTGTLGLLLDAKQANLIPTVRPYMDQLHDLRFRLAAQTRSAVLKLADEEE